MRLGSKRFGWRKMGLLGSIGLLLLQLMGSAGAQAAEGETVPLPPRLAKEAVEHTITSAENGTVKEVIHRDLLPEAYRTFAMVSRTAFPTGALDRGLSLDLVMSRLTPSPYGPNVLSTTRTYKLDEPLTIMTFLYAQDGRMLAYHLDELQSGEKSPFSDVPSNHWAFKDIKAMSERKWLDGYENGTYQPDRIVTRAEFAKIMVLASGLSLPRVEISSFEDISPGDWFAPYVEAAMPYLTGYLLPNGNVAYRPNEPALREDITIGIVKLKEYGVETNSNLDALAAKFSDFPAIANVAKKYVAAAVKEGLISGFPDGTFRPKDALTRAQAASILAQAFPYGIDNKVEFPFPNAEPDKRTGLSVATEGLNKGAALMLSFADSNRVPLSTQIIQTLAGEFDGVTKRVYGNDRDVIAPIKPAANVLNQSPYVLLEYRLEGKADRFTARLGVESAKAAAVRFQIWADNKLLFRSESVPSGAYIPVDLPVTGAQQLRLEVFPLQIGTEEALAVIRSGTLIREP